MSESVVGVFEGILIEKAIVGAMQVSLVFVVNSRCVTVEYETDGSSPFA